MKTSQQALLELCQNPSDSAVVERLISPHAEELAALFYRNFLRLDDARRFLDNKLVEERLHRSMQDWIRELLRVKDEHEIDAFIQRQLDVGTVHARINIPLTLFNRGIRLLKNEFIRLIMESGLPLNTMSRALHIATDLLDISADLINNRYVQGVVEDERSGQTIRLKMVGHNLALDCERLRAGMFDWQRRLLSALYTHRTALIQDQICFESLEVKLWLDHKAALLFPRFDEIPKLHQELSMISGILDAIKHKGDEQEVDETLIEGLTSAVNSVAWLLSSLAEHAIKSENTRDPLTRLLNRRYLPMIMQSEIRLSAEASSTFAVMILDIDRFKTINDNYGHDAGDQVLKQFSEIMHAAVRASDYIFRYGGEEFLIIVNNSLDEDNAMRVAEKIRSAVETASFAIKSVELSMTVSIGVAIHDGHPDYTHLVKKADHALYQAKEAGRNTCVLAE